MRGGKGIALRLAAAALLAALASDSTLAADVIPGTCGLTRLINLEMRTDPDGLIAIPAAIDDMPILLTVDTGAIHSAISARVADQLHLVRDRSSVTYTLPGGVQMTQMAYSHSFRLGALSAGRLGLMVAPTEALHPDSDGMLGSDALNFYDVEIDYAGGHFALFSQTHCPGQVVYWTHQTYAKVPMHVDRNWHISVPITLDGKKIDAYIDTGAEHSTMSLAAARELFGLNEHDTSLARVEGVTINGMGSATIFHRPFAALQLEGIAVTNPDIDIIDEKDLGKDAPKLIVGAGVLRQLHIYLAYREQTLYATNAEAR
ncbi:MAG TPA: aspartyl protease family protein [Rhizomicrobium sp.]|jgi:predicted aspartyl protease